MGAAMAVALGLLTAAPAAAAYTATVTFPGGNTEFYSPFGGPASIQFDFQPGDDSTVFRVRLRPVGGTAIKTQYFSVNPASQSSPQIRYFSWPALSTNSDKPYEVLVNPDGQPISAQATFILRPRLVTITGASPNPFLPWVDDDIKDETHISYKLAAASNPTVIKVFAATAQGKCCATPPVFVQDDGPHAEGTNQYTWNGRTAEGPSGTLLPKGDYFVRITAEDSANVVKTSKPFKVSIARTYRATFTKQKDGILMHHTGPVTSYRRGGNCFVTKDETDRDLWITCLSASFTVYWRWALPTGGRVESASFVYVHVSSEICNGKKGITKTDSFLKVGGVGQFRCRIDTAKITYSVPTPS
jgi:hypothetical protein